MKKIDSSQVFSALANIGVIAGILFLGFEIRQNTLISRGIAVQSIERKTLKTFAVYAAVATSFWRFRHYHLRRPEPKLYDKHVEMQTLADIISKYPDSRFAELFAEKTTAATSGEDT